MSSRGFVRFRNSSRFERPGQAIADRLQVIHDIGAVAEQEVVEGRIAHCRYGLENKIVEPVENVGLVFLEEQAQGSRHDQDDEKARNRETKDQDQRDESDPAREKEDRSRRSVGAKGILARVRKEPEKALIECQDAQGGS